MQKVSNCSFFAGKYNNWPSIGKIRVLKPSSQQGINLKKLLLHKTIHIQKFSTLIYVQLKTDI